MPGDFKAKFIKYSTFNNWTGCTNNDVNFINKALLSIFDGEKNVLLKSGNNDGVISEAEFSNMTVDDYNKYKDEIKSYYKSVYGKDLDYHIPSYYELNMLLKTEKEVDFSAGFYKGKKITQVEITEFILADGQIGQTEQMDSGDCYLESPLISLSCTAEGQNLISRSIKPNLIRGGYEVTLYGAEIKNGKYVPIGTEGSRRVSKTYFISQKELKAAQEEFWPNGSKKYNTGDPDMVLIAMSVERYRKDTQSNPVYLKNRKAQKGYDDYLSTGEESLAVQLLTGRASVVYRFKSGTSTHAGVSKKTILKQRTRSVDVARACLMESTKSPWQTCSFAASSAEEDKLMKKYGVINGHAYAVANINTKAQKVTLINTWNGKRNEGKKITIPISDFIKILCDLSAFDT